MYKNQTTPKFRKNDNVRYTKKYVNEITLKLINSSNEINWSKMPFGNLIIYEEPYWNSKYNEWMYNYHYGFGNLSEGSCNESNLEKSDFDTI